MSELKKEKRGGICFYNCDNIEFMKTKPDNYYDLAVVDPPYGIERFKKPSGTTRFKSSKLMQEKGLTWDKKPPKEYWTELFRISKNQIVWGANNFEMPPSEYFLIWNKKQTVDNFAGAEYAWVSMGLKKPAKIFDFGIHKHNTINKIHPTQKPVDLYRYILQTYATNGNRIVDTHGGSCVNAIACDTEGFNLDIIEIDQKYFNDGLNAFDVYKRQLKLF